MVKFPTDIPRSFVIIKKNNVQLGAAKMLLHNGVRRKEWYSNMNYVSVGNYKFRLIKH